MSVVGIVQIAHKGPQCDEIALLIDCLPDRLVISWGFALEHILKHHWMGIGETHSSPSGSGRNRPLTGSGGCEYCAYYNPILQCVFR